MDITKNKKSTLSEDKNFLVPTAPKNLYITEKPSVAMEFAKALGMNLGARKNGYIEDGDNIVTWCVGHLVSLSNPDAYDEEYKKWELEPLPIIPHKYLYQVLSNTKPQYQVVSTLLNRDDVDKIYYSGDSAREGEYIQRLVRQLAGHNPNAEEYRVWIDSQTKEEILKGIRTAHELSYYDSLSDSAYARAIEDWLVGMNFSRALSIKYARMISAAAGLQKAEPIRVGRVMSCVLGMIVERERLIRTTDTIPFYGIKADLDKGIEADWKIVKGSKYENAGDDIRYKDAGLLKKEPVDELIGAMNSKGTATIKESKRSEEKKTAPLLFNLAELQAECTKAFHISPAKTLEIAQTLYEKKLTTYPRTDARVLTTAICKVYDKNIKGIGAFPHLKVYSDTVINNSWQEKLRNKKTKYVDDAQVSDHYAIIPTGEGNDTYDSLSSLEKDVYTLIAKRFLSIFYPEAVYDRLNLTVTAEGETFTASFSAIKTEGYLEVAGHKAEPDAARLLSVAASLTGTVPAKFTLKEGKSKPPSRYTSGSMILAMENAGKLIEDPELREQISGSGIGTSATRAEIISKLEKCNYIKINPKNQQITPDKMGELIYDILFIASPKLLNPELTAKWETGLQEIVDKKQTKDQYLEELNQYIKDTVKEMKDKDCTDSIKKAIEALKKVYKDIGQRSSLSQGSEEIGVNCPACGKPLMMNAKGMYCSGYKDGCKMAVRREVFYKSLSDADLIKFVKTSTKDGNGVITSEESAVMRGLKSKDGKKFDAALIMTKAPDDYPKFQLKFAESGIICPRCGSPMRINDNGIYCTGYKNGCKVNIRREMLKKKLSDANLKALIKDAKVDENGVLKSPAIGPISGFAGRKGTFQAKIYLEQTDPQSYTNCKLDFS